MRAHRPLDRAGVGRLPSVAARSASPPRAPIRKRGGTRAGPT